MAERIVPNDFGVDMTRLEDMLRSHDRFWPEEEIVRLIRALNDQDDEFLVESMRACLSVLTSRIMGNVNDVSVEGWHHNMKRVLDLMRESISRGSS